MREKKSRKSGAAKTAGRTNSEILERKKKMQRLMQDIKVKFEELDSIREDLDKEDFRTMTPVKSRKMLEEIRVPSLEIIKEDKKKA